MLMEPESRPACAYRKLYPSGFLTLNGSVDAWAGDRDSDFRADRAACAAEIKLFLPNARIDGAVDLETRSDLVERCVRIDIGSYFAGL